MLRQERPGRSDRKCGADLPWALRVSVVPGRKRIGRLCPLYGAVQRPAAESSADLASTHAEPSVRSSFFQNGARVLR